LSQKKFWDATTRKVVEDRVANVPPIRFFTPAQLEIIMAVCDRVMPQDDRLSEYRIPIVNSIDERLWKNEISGYRFEDMPEDREAYRLGLFRTAWPPTMHIRRPGMRSDMAGLLILERIRAWRAVYLNRGK
jgi:hypothetical protein